MTTLDQLKKTHHEYDEYISEWRFLADSYHGGRRYQEAGYLTRYYFESESEYRDRLDQTPYDNHCHSIIHLYDSFIFSSPPHRDFGTWTEDPQLQDFLEDADMEGRSWDQFMRQVDITTSIYGAAWIVVDKPAVELMTAAEEQAFGVRPYVALYSPINVIDWKFTRQLNGSYQLTYVKVIEESDDEAVYYKEFMPDVIRTWRVSENNRGLEPELISEVVNALGRVPVVVAYHQRGDDRGIGISAISDIARVNRAIYDDTSELVQIIRLSNHPSLVKTAGTQAAAGAGAIIQMPEDLPGDLKPYLLQPDSASLDGVRAAIADKVNAINRMAAVGSVRAFETRTLSGVAMETEMRTLNARLAEKGDQLELVEEQVFELWAAWQQTEWTGEIDYPDTFNARDRNHELALLKSAAEFAVDNEDLKFEIQRQVAEIIIQDPDRLAEVVRSIEEYAQQEDQTEPHTMVNPQTGESRTVTTQQEHETLMAQGWTHPDEPTYQG